MISSFIHSPNSFSFLIFKNILLTIFRERGREGERERGKHQCKVASCMPPTGDLDCNPGMCPDWEWNLRSFGSKAGTQSTEPHQPGHHSPNTFRSPVPCPAWSPELVRTEVSDRFMLCVPWRNTLASRGHQSKHNHWHEISAGMRPQRSGEPRRCSGNSGYCARSSR